MIFGPWKKVGNSETSTRANLHIHIHIRSFNLIVFSDYFNHTIFQKTIRAYWSTCRVETNSSFQNHPDSFRDYHYMVLPQTLPICIFIMQCFKIVLNHTWFSWGFFHKGKERRNQTKVGRVFVWVYCYYTFYNLCKGLWSTYLLWNVSRQCINSKLKKSFRLNGFWHFR